VSTQAAPATIIPNLFVDSVEPLQKFYLDKLGFSHMMGIVGKDGRLDFCIVTRDGAMVMLGRPEDRIEGTTRRPLALYFYFQDVDAYHTELQGRGVRVTEPLTTQWWGDRNFAVEDPYGYQLWFCQTVGEPQPPPGVTMI
jgi:uncharacterized glyoxalase superfamily protein PhnB